MRTIFITLVLCLAFGLTSCTQNSGPINIGAPLAGYNKQAPAIGYLYRRFIEVNSVNSMFSDQEGTDLLEAMDMVKLLVAEMNADSIAGTLDEEAFDFYTGKLTEKWKVMKTVLDRHFSVYPEDVSIIYSKTRLELDEALAACNSLLSESKKSSIDWLLVEKYGEKLATALGPYINMGGLI